jgi:hypothetical protein
MSKYVARRGVEVTPSQVFLMSFILLSLGIAAAMLGLYLRKVPLDTFWVFDFSAARFHEASNRTVVVHAGESFGPWLGWGTSLAWWAGIFGDRTDLADLFFTTDFVTVLINMYATGLGC